MSRREAELCFREEHERAKKQLVCKDPMGGRRNNTQAKSHEEGKNMQRWKTRLKKYKK